MFARTSLLVAAMVLCTFLLAGLLSPRDLREGRGARVLAEAATRPDRATSTKVVRAKLPAAKPVVVRAGDIVDLEIASAEPDVARLGDLGFDVAVGPDLPGAVRVVTDRAGRFEVRLDLADEVVGVLRVRSRAGS